MPVFKRNRKAKLEALPPVLEPKPQNPVNYNSVLDYLVGLSQVDYDKMCKVTGIYRDANAKAAEVLGVEDQPTTILKEPKPTDDEIDEGLDAALIGQGDDFLAEEDEPQPPEYLKEQAPSKETKIDVQG